MTKDTIGKVGSWAFLGGVILALVLGLWSGYTNTALGSVQLGLLLLIVIGLVIGFLNIKGKETTPFLMSGAVLILASALGQGIITSAQGLLAQLLKGVLDALLAVFVPATVIVAIKNVFVLAKD